MSNAKSDGLMDEIVDYWDGRATSYSNGVKGELSDDRAKAWWQVLERKSMPIMEAVAATGRSTRVLDLGCGPGFFTVLYTRAGCQVDAVDSSAQMLNRAQTNLAEALPGAHASFLECDITSLPYADDTFDLAVCRNVTWLMRQPEAAYAEWLRVLRTGGKLLVFDANWYRYLVDEQVDAQRLADITSNTLEGWDEDAQATSDEEKRCELIATELPLTKELRPYWDLKVLQKLDAAVRADEEIWRELWTENEQAYYSYAPMFLVEAVK